MCLPMFFANLVIFVNRFPIFVTGHKWTDARSLSRGKMSHNSNREIFRGIILGTMIFLTLSMSSTILSVHPAIPVFDLILLHAISESGTRRTVNLGS